MDPLMPRHLIYRLWLHAFWWKDTFSFAENATVSLGNIISSSHTQLQFWGKISSFGLLTSVFTARKLRAEADGRNTQPHIVQGSTTVSAGLWRGNLLLAYFEHLSSAVMNHIKENKTSAQTNPPFSWVSWQLHCVWNTMDVSWLNQYLHAKGILVDQISQIIHAQMDSSNCYAHPFLLLIFLQLDYFLR